MYWSIAHPQNFPTPLTLKTITVVQGVQIAGCTVRKFPIHITTLHSLIYIWTNIVLENSVITNLLIIGDENVNQSKSHIKMINIRQWEKFPTLQLV